MPDRSLTRLALILCLLAVSLKSPGESLRDPTRPYTATPPARHADTRFIVSAIFVSGERRIAIVNGQKIKAGDTIDGATVIEVLNDEVRLQYQNAVISTRLASSGLRNQT